MALQGTGHCSGGGRGLVWGPRASWRPWQPPVPVTPMSVLRRLKEPRRKGRQCARSRSPTSPGPVISIKCSNAGAKYMDLLMEKTFPDAKFSEIDRCLFAFASYNAGPGNISRMRKLAAKRDLNPDQWFNQVEIVAAQKIGMETTTYVRNIYKYYVSYKLRTDAQEMARKAREQVTPGATK